MFTAAAFCQALEELGSDFYVGVPDTVIKSFCNHIIANPPASGHVIAQNEGGAIGMAAGHYCATGRIPVVYMQNSGIGNAVNPLLSMADRSVFAVPMLLLVGWRGEPGVKDEPQHVKQGRVSKALFDAMEIPCGVISPDLVEAKEALRTAFGHMRSSPGPYALLVRNGCFEPEPAVAAGHDQAEMTREVAIDIIIRNTSPEAAFVASTGMGPRELYELRGKAGQGHERDFLNAGAMGHASMIAAGVARAQPGRSVVCLDGDGAAIMHMGALPLVASMKLRNFVHILLNNGVHDSVGGQANLAAKLNLSDFARDCGYEKIHKTYHLEELADIVRDSMHQDGPYFIEAVLARGFRKDLGRPGIPFAEAGEQFRAFLAARP